MSQVIGFSPAADLKGTQFDRERKGFGCQESELLNPET
jgi:hypothetical protein